MLKVRWVRSLMGAELARLDTGPDLRLPSPTRIVSCPQDCVEVALAGATAGRRGAVRFGTEATSLNVGESGVTATMADGPTVRARYVIAADGAASGIPRELRHGGPPGIGHPRRHLLPRRPSCHLRGTTRAAKPKIHVVDSGVAARLMRLTPERLATLDPTAQTEFGDVLETFTIGALLKQAS